MNIIEGIQEETKRCRELIKIYGTIQTGAFGAMMISQDIKRGEQAIASGDVVEMIVAYKALEACK